MHLRLSPSFLSRLAVGQHGHLAFHDRHAHLSQVFQVFQAFQVSHAFGTWDELPLLGPLISPRSWL